MDKKLIQYRHDGKMYPLRFLLPIYPHRCVEKTPRIQYDRRINNTLSMETESIPSNSLRLFVVVSFPTRYFFKLR